MVVAKSFQSTLPRRERHITSAAAAGLAHFNPRSREGSDVAPVVHGRWVFISIHAPAKGATLPPYHEHPRQAISIHAPVKGATLPGSTNDILSLNFNPRSREGSDPYLAGNQTANQNFNPRSREGSDVDVNLRAARVGISIHAPVKGATISSLFAVRSAIFQSTLP